MEAGILKDSLVSSLSMSVLSKSSNFTLETFQLGLRTTSSPMLLSK